MRVQRNAQRISQWMVWTVAGLAAVALTPAPAQAEWSFAGLGVLAGDSESAAFDVSSDGSVVVGYSRGANFQAVRWDSGVPTGLGVLPGKSSSAAGGVAANGSAVVGVSDVPFDEPFRWESGATQNLGTLPGAPTSLANASACSADGTFAVGTAPTANPDSTSGSEAFRWESGTMVGLGAVLPGGGFFTVAADVSSDGSIVVGEAQFPDGRHEALRWEDGVSVVLGDLAGGDVFSAAFAVSADGQTVVGAGNSAPGDPLATNEAFRWKDGVIEGLGDLAGDPFKSVAHGVSGNGSVVVGSGNIPPSVLAGEAFIWDAQNGMRGLQAVLEAEGLDLSGWTLQSAQAVSDNGTTVVGYGIDPLGLREAFIATIPAPENEIVYDLAADWSDAVNPGSVWSYNDENLEPITTHWADWDPSDVCCFPDVQPAWAAQQFQAPGHVPVWLRAATVSTSHDLPPGRVGTHGSGVGTPGRSSVTFTSPIHASVQVQGGVWKLLADDGRNADWTLYRNAQAVTGGSLLSGGPYSSATPFDLADGFGGPEVISNLPMEIGDSLVVEFAKTTADSSWAGIDLTIVANQTDCSDGIDNDQDTATDYPIDTGCFGPLDTSEAASPCGLGGELLVPLFVLIALGKVSRRADRGFGSLDGSAGRLDASPRPRR